MRCKICGAKLANDNADICLNCYKDYQEDEDLKKDINERLIVKRKYKIANVLLKYIEIIIIFILAILSCFSMESYLGGIFGILALVVFIVVILAISKIIAKNTKAVFYDKKVIYTSKNLFYKTEKTIKYTDLKDISMFQTRRQKTQGFGDICFYVKSNVPGTGFFNGFQIKDVENIEQTLQEIYSVIGLVENN